MGIEEKVLNSKKLAKKVEFITIQASEQSDNEVRYKNINRKQIRFDLNDLPMMQMIGELLHPYGLMQYFENVFSDSKITFLKILGEKRLAKRGANFLRALYLKHPEKFSSVDLSNQKSTRMFIIRGTMVISEQVNQKTISLKDEKEDYLSELESFRRKFKEEEAKLKQQEAVVKELTSNDENQALIGVGA
ncbi:MAG: hypothetical protein KDK64_03685 [Chlamydiia bacterium]|nr:hypothetical protein [Chlamydiia bacterium]